MTIYERIDGLLAEKKMSRRKLAQQAGILEGTLSTAFARKTKLKFETILKISKVLGMSPWELLDGTDIYDDMVSQMQYNAGQAFANAERIAQELNDGIQPVKIITHDPIVTPIQAKITIAKSDGEDARSITSNPNDSIKRQQLLKQMNDDVQRISDLDDLNAAARMINALAKDQNDV